MSSFQEIYGRRGRVVTDQNANAITRVEELAYDLKVGDVMTNEVRSASPDMSMSDLLELLRDGQISGVPVLENGRLVGIISLEDLIRALRSNDIDKPIRAYMTAKSIVTISPFEPIIKALETFTHYKIGRMPVLDEAGKLIGMLTKGDITRGFLIALQKDYQEEEVRRYRASHLFEDIDSDLTSLILRYRIKPRDYMHGGNASGNIKRALLRLGANPQIARRCGIAIYEAEMNLIIHTTDGGLIRIEIEPHRILMQATDEGPGIADIDQAMKAGYSTATEEVREMGFGAGMGLVNIKRCVDRMSLKSELGKGTKLEMKIYLQPEESFDDKSSYEEEKALHDHYTRRDF